MGMGMGKGICMGSSVSVEVLQLSGDLFSSVDLHFRRYM
jgi:hypothetical protein